KPHEVGLARVTSRRDGKLAGPQDELFSGAYWTGRRALELGLVDAIGDLRGVLHERFGDKVVTPLVSAERGWLGRRLLGAGRSEDLPAPAQFGLAEDCISALEAGAIWARYGL